MKYDTIQIRQKVGGPLTINSANTQEWEVIFWRDDTDMRRKATKPNALGFYHYPRLLISDKRAFDKLRLVMMKAHRDEITRLEKSLNKLMALKL